MRSRTIRFALPKGRILRPILERLASAGLDVPDRADLESRRLVFERGGVEWILVKDCDVPVYVGHGAADAGVAGLDQLLEQMPDVLEPVSFDAGRCRLMLISRQGTAPLESLSRPLVATKYPNVTRRWLSGRRIDAEIVVLAGSVELAAVLGLAPYIVDLVETGETIRVHGLEAIEMIAEISPRLIVNRGSFRLQPDAIRSLVASIATAEANRILPAAVGE